MTAREQAGNVAVFALALGHALLTWPTRATVALFVGGAAVAFVAEAAVIRAGLLRHHVAPRLLGVPLTVILAWPGVVYVAYRVALLAAPAGTPAAALAALLATLLDAGLDPAGVRDGRWTYPESRLSRLRFRGVPWWNFAGWLAVVFLTAHLPALAT